MQRSVKELGEIPAFLLSGGEGGATHTTCIGQSLHSDGWSPVTDSHLCDAGSHVTDSHLRDAESHVTDSHIGRTDSD